MKGAKKKIDWPGSTPNGKKRVFLATVTKRVEITFDETVIEQGLLPDSPIFGNRLVGDPRAWAEKEVVEHLAFNLIGNDLPLSHIDGYANCPDESAVVGPSDWEVELDVVKEVQPPSFKKSTAVKRRPRRQP